MNSNYLQSNLSQTECTKLIIDDLHELTELFLYHMRRYKVPVTLLLIYSEEDLSAQLNQHKRLTDIAKYIKLPCGYFNFIFLPFTDTEDTHSYVKLLVNDFLLNTKHFIYFDELKNENHNTFNFINTYLFNIAEQVICEGHENCELPQA
jgi:hypothetical protein